MPKLLNTLIIILIFLIFWEGLVVLFGFPTYLFPSFTKVFLAFCDNWSTLLNNAGITFFEAFIGFLAANFISLVIAVTIAFYRKFENVVMSIAIILKTMPVVALVPLLIIWFGSGVFSKIIIAMLICFFPAIVNILRGIKSIDDNLIEFFRVYSANRWQLIKFLIIPSVLPYFFAALKVSSSLAVIGALVGEFIGSNKGLGFLIISNYYNMNMPFVFASIIVSSLMGIFFYYAIHFLEKKIVLDSREII